MTRGTLTALGVFTLVAALGFEGGGYAATAWGWSAILLFGVLGVLIVRGIGRPRTAALLFVGALAALVAWTATSLLWSSHVSATALDVQRTLVYLGAAALLVLAGRGKALLAGVLGAVTLLCGYGLANWLLGSPEVPLSADPQAAERLSEPIGYANGVALLATMGLLLSVGFAARASRAPAAAAAAATGPLFAATLYFTFGRGAWLALAVGLTVALAVGPGRLQLAATALALAAPAAIAVVSAARLGASGSLAAFLLVLCALSMVVPLVLRSGEARYRPSLRARQAFAVTLVALPVVVAAAVLREGEVLAAQRTRPPALAGRWELPGGRVEVGEQEPDAVVRELREELGIDVAENCLAPFAFASHGYETFHLLMPLYVCRRWSDMVTAREGQELKWVKPQNLRSYAMPPADIPLIPYLIDML
jgi:8-oxo-dGTP diphosphatase